MGRKQIPKELKRKVMTCYLSPFQIEQLDKLAKKNDRARIYIIDKAINEYIEKYSEKENT